MYKNLGRVRIWGSCAPPKMWRWATTLGKSAHKRCLRRCYTVNRATQRDEMCNLYLMYYTKASRSYTAGGHTSQLTCSGVDQPDLLSSIPSDSDVELPSDPDLDEDTDQFSHTHHRLSGQCE